MAKRLNASSKSHSTPRNDVKCDSCGLGFNHRSSLARHVRKTCGQDQSVSKRRKSCSQCAIDKARCSLDRPECLRCRGRGTSCHYLVRRTVHHGIHEEQQQHDEPDVSLGSDFMESSGAMDRNSDNELPFRLSEAPRHANPQDLQGHDIDIEALGLFSAAGPMLPITSTPFMNSPYSAAEYQARSGITPSMLLDIFSLPEFASSTSSTPFANSPVNLHNTPPSFDTTCALENSFSTPANMESTVTVPFPSSFWPSGVNSQNGPGSQLVYNSMELILRVLRSWPSMLVDEFQYPPLFHHTQVPFLRDDGTSASMPAPLANCITLTKMWHGQQSGAEQLVQETILREVDGLLNGFKNAEKDTQLCILQVLVTYTILILSPSKGWRSARSVDTALFARIKRTVQSVIGEELYPREERNKQHGPHSGFGWHDWIHVTAKRRAVLSLYLLHWAYSMYNGVHSFDCRELSFMPAPAAKVLWEARTEREWESLYARWLGRWKGQRFLQGEFDGICNGIVLGERAERWLQEVDEFGFIMMAIVNATDFQQMASL